MPVVGRGAAEHDAGRMTATGRRSRHHVVLAVAATCLVSVLVAWAALVGPPQVFTGPGPVPGGPETTAATTPSSPLETTAPPPEGTGDRSSTRQPPWWVRLVVEAMRAIAAVGVLLGLVGIGYVVWQTWDGRRRRPDAVPGVDFASLPTSARIEEELRADTGEQDALLRAGTPRNAIVAAWHRFELQGERAGAPRRPSETSTEFTARLLDLVGADASAVGRLGELYREARFSSHELSEQHRAAALEALAAIRASMGTRR